MVIGYFPEYFEQLTARLHDRVEQADSDDADDRVVPSAEAPSAVDVAGPANPAPAPWIRDSAGWFFDDDTETTMIELTADANDLLDPDAIELVPDEYWLDVLFAENGKLRGRMTADVIALYRPWHLYREHWGIYVSEPAITVFTGGLARITGASLGQLAPLALRQILEHE